jgi:pimeloyl-ACP methyl ester carboxylesterase
MPFFQAKDGTELFYTSWGDGLPVVLIHGNNIGSDLWSFQIAHLIEKGFRCISYDQRGFGRSDAPSSGYDADTLAGDLHSLIETLGLSKTSLIAYSIGAGVVARFLSRFGTNSIDRIILLSPVTPCFLKTNDNPEGLEAEVTYGPFRSGLISDKPHSSGTLLMRSSILMVRRTPYQKASVTGLSHPRCRTPFFRFWNSLASAMNLIFVPT